MEKKVKRPRGQAAVAILLLLLTAAVWLLLFYPHQSVQELPGQARRSEALDYDGSHGGLYMNSIVYALAAEDSSPADMYSLCARIGAETVEVAEGLYQLRFPEERSASELDGIAIWLEESPLVEAAFLATLTRSPYALSAATDYETSIPLLERARSLWESQRWLMVVAGAAVMAVCILLPAALSALHGRKKENRV